MLVAERVQSHYKIPEGSRFEFYFGERDPLVFTEETRNHSIQILKWTALNVVSEGDMPLAGGLPVVAGLSDPRHAYLFARLIMPDLSGTGISNIL